VNPEVFAAGGLVTRRGADGVEILVVHRPRYDDWTFPKGKRDPGETDEETARREVFEETGLGCELVEELGTTEYVDNRGRAKQVRYWIMRLDDPTSPFVANAEVDEVRWLRPDAARGILSYGHDRELLDRAAAGGLSR
jgi:8-oxo-dGTP diphosphatase